MVNATKILCMLPRVTDSKDAGQICGVWEWKKMSATLSSYNRGEIKELRVCNGDPMAEARHM